MAANSSALLAEFYQPLFRYLCRAAGQADIARDLTQDVFLRASRVTAPPTSRTELQAWLFRIARNIVIDHHRRSRRTPDEVPAEQAPHRPASQDVAVAVNAALATLADLDRDVFLMREVAGLGYEEIAKACEISAGGVRSRIHRARLQLRQQLAAPIALHRTSTMRMFPKHD
jgi:RNA polymerase sigma-70 factor (ECF subfamily)